MCCPHCGCEASRVLDTRRYKREVYRRRHCANADCGKKYITVETAPPRLKMPMELIEAGLEAFRARQAAAARQHN